MAERSILKRGERVQLGEMLEEDQPKFHRWQAGNPELRMLIDDPRTPSMEDQLRWYERTQKTDRTMFSLLTKDHELIGHGGLVDIDREKGSAQLRITIGNPEYWGKGCGTEATRLIADHAFTVLHLPRIFLRVLKENARAIRSYEKAGFQREESSPPERNAWGKEIVRMFLTSKDAPASTHTFKRGDVPASAITYVRNGGPAFEDCLRSVLFCKEHVVLDGGSTDGTVERARRYGCRVLPQDFKFLNAEGCIIDFGGIVNQAYQETRERWVVLLAADEAFDVELMESIKEVIRSGKKGAYFVNRYFVLDGHVMLHASTNPNHQIRLCHRDAVTGFQKVVHERPVLAPGITPRLLPRGLQRIPLTDSPGALKQKYRRYLALEEARSFSSFGWLRWTCFAFWRLLIMMVLMGRMLRFRILHDVRDCLPLRYDMLNIWYGWQLILRSCPLRRAGRITPTPSPA